MNTCSTGAAMQLYYNVNNSLNDILNKININWSVNWN